MDYKESPENCLILISVSGKFVLFGGDKISPIKSMHDSNKNVVNDESECVFILVGPCPHLKDETFMVDMRDYKHRTFH